MRALQDRKRNRRSSGMMLMELLGMLMIIAAVSVLVGNLVVMLMRTTRATAERDTMIARVDATMDQLRRDAWGATALRVSGDSLEIDGAQGTITWNAGANGLTRLVTGETARAWRGIPHMQFIAGASPATVVVSVDSGEGGSAKRETLTVASQRLLVGGPK